MKKILMIIMLMVAMSSASEWWEGGTLHGASVKEWKQATYSNKMATSADWILTLYNEGSLTGKIVFNSPDDVKILCKSMVSALDDAVSEGGYKGEQIALVSAMIMMLAGWMK